jgi:hypothetical protein
VSSLRWLPMFAVLSAACGSGMTSGGSLDAAGGSDVAPGDEASHDAGRETGGSDGGTNGTDAPPESSGKDSAPDTGLPACCTRSTEYDSKCTSLGEPPEAYVCFCPGGSIDPACTINMGTELVCCP